MPAADRGAAAQSCCFVGQILSWAGLLLLSLLLWVAILWGVMSVLHRLGHPIG